MRAGVGVLVLVCATGAAQSTAQNRADPQPEIRGIVTEPGTEAPISAAAVRLFEEPAQGSVITGSSFSERTTLVEIETDAGGGFLFQPDKFGSYRVQVHKEGYRAFGPMMKPQPDVAIVRLSREHPTAEVKLKLARPGAVTGVIVDDETQEPVENLRVLLMQIFYMNGQRRFAPAGVAKTDPHGRFRAEGVLAGDYLLAVLPRLVYSGRVLKEFSKEDLASPDTDYEERYWPGGTDFDSAVPFNAGSNVTVNIGQIVVRKSARYRAHVTFPAGSCDAGETASVNLIRSRSWSEGLGSVPCGKDFLLRGFAPGQYRLDIEVERTRANRVRGDMSFAVTDKNVNVAAPLVRGIDIEGKVVVSSQAAPPPLDKIKVSLRPVASVPYADEMPSIPDDKGLFRVVNAHLGEQRIFLGGISDPFYVKEVRYNGGAIEGIVIPLNAGAATHSIEIELDDKPARVQGKATNGSHAARGAFVALARWPVGSPEALWPLRSTTCDEDGMFSFGVLAPGEYRVIAVPGDQQDKLQEPRVLESLLPSAKKVTLAAGVQNVSVEVR